MTASTGILFALATTISWSICVFPFTEAAKRLGPNPLNHFRLLIATLLIMALALFSDPDGFTSLFDPSGLHAWFWLGLSGVLGLTIGDHFGFGMYTILGARLGSVLTTFAPGAALAVGIVLTGDRLTTVGILGMLITITGVITISLSRRERNNIPESRHGSIAKGVVYGLLAAFCQGAGLVLAKRGMSTGDLHQVDVSAIQATFIRLSAATLSLFLLTTFRGGWKQIYHPVRSNQEKGIVPALLGTLFGPVIGVSLSLATVARLDASVAQTIFSLVPVVVLLLAVAFKKEPIRPASVLGVFVAVSGVLVLVWRDTIQNMFDSLLP